MMTQSMVVELVPYLLPLLPWLCTDVCRYMCVDTYVSRIVPAAKLASASNKISSQVHCNDSHIAIQVSLTLMYRSGATANMILIGALLHSYLSSRSNYLSLCLPISKPACLQQIDHPVAFYCCLRSWHLYMHANIAHQQWL